jgi:tRNA nucleotidyltransferase (CCA-adding enzyme)
MAYHPKKGLVDLFDGQGDLNRRVIACVGDPVTRFREDGLRILRAMRFASVLDFSIDPATAKAIHGERALLCNIAPERIREEFCKLLCGKGAVRILREYADVMGVFLPDLLPCVGFAQNSKYHCFDVWEHTLHALEESAPDLITRLSLLLHDIGKPAVYFEDEEGGHFKGHAAVSVEITGRVMKALRFDNATAARVSKLVEIHDMPLLSGEKYVKRLMQKLTDEDILRLLEIQRCDRLAHAPAYSIPAPVLQEIPPVMQAIRESDACLSLKTLAVGGFDLMSLGIPKGKEVGSMLERLLDAVVDGDLPNEKEALLQAAEGWLKELL